MVFPRVKSKIWDWLLPPDMGCVYCRWPFGVKAESSCTMYHWDGEGDDPNRPILLCRVCAEAHYEHWDAMWLEARAGW